MVFAPSFLSTCDCGIIWDVARNPDFKLRATFERISFSVLGGDCDQSGNSALRSIAVVAGRRGPVRAVRMSNTPAEQPSVASKDGAAENATKTVNVIIKGKVQGVYYRNWTVDSAQQLAVNGWVRNLKDGSVEAVFSGKSAVVDSLIQKCYTGPSAARVNSVDVSPWKDEVPQGFERKPTIW